MAETLQNQIAEDLLADIEAEMQREQIKKERARNPVAKLITAEEEAGSMFGFMKGTVKINGDIIAPLDEKWNVEAKKEGHTRSGVE